MSRSPSSGACVARTVFGVMLSAAISVDVATDVLPALVGTEALREVALGALFASASTLDEDTAFEPGAARDSLASFAETFFATVASFANVAATNALLPTATMY